MEPLEEIPTVKFAPRKNPDHPALPIKTKRREYGDKACSHKQTTIDKEARTLTCDACGVQLDPIEKLLDWAHFGMRLDSRIAEIREYEQKKQEATARRLQNEKECVPKIAGSLKAGDKVLVETPSSRVHGTVIELEPTMLHLDCGDCFRPSFEIDDITKLRVIKRLKA